MNVSEFVKAVSEMMDAQQVYFKSRLRGDLLTAKDLERRVRKAIKDGAVFDLDIVDAQGRLIEPAVAQPNLFEEAGNETAKAE